MLGSSREAFDPRAGLPADERTRLRRMAGDAARAAWASLMATLELDEDAAWRAETGRDERGWTGDERARFALWQITGADLVAARAAWRFETRLRFAGFLVETGRIGRGDEVTAR